MLGLCGSSFPGWFIRRLLLVVLGLELQPLSRKPPIPSDDLIKRRGYNFNVKWGVKMISYHFILLDPR